MKYVVLVPLVVFIAKCLTQSRTYRIYIENRYVRPDKLIAIQSILETTMNAFDEIANAHNITYWSDSGTTLGIVRHHGLIPWDDDIDLMVPTESIEKLKKAVSTTESTDGVGIDRGTEYILDYADHIYRFRKKGRSEYIDLFECTDFGTYHDYSDVYNRKRWSKARVYNNELFPLRKYTFGGLNIYGPKNPLPYLRRMYGKWETPKIVKGHHDV
jgi:lipopolysaccharide cholinephosphotransferase